jgi:predicted enzyme related to lactoylglutathione lyase
MPSHAKSVCGTRQTQRTAVTSLGVQVVLAVSDLGRSLDFYERTFDWPRNERIDYSDYVELLPPDGGAVGLFETGGYSQLVGADAALVPHGRVAPAYVYVRVPDVEATATRLEEAGGRPLSPLAPRSWGDEAAWLADPDGNVIAVAQSATPGS